jgi:hypothetical protein
MSQILGAQTDRFQYYYVDTLGPAGGQLCLDLVPRIEADYRVLSSWFGGVQIDSFDLHADLGTNGASHWDCGARDIHYDWSPGRTADHAAMLVDSEVVEVFEANFDGNWDCGNSMGEALSRVLAETIYPAYPGQLNGQSPAEVWLDGPRNNWILYNEGTDLNYESTGCAALFLNWLHFQLGIAWNQIISVTRNLGDLTPEHLYHQLFGSGNWNSPGSGVGWNTFKSFIDAQFPPGTASGLKSNNPFPFIDFKQWHDWQPLGAPPAELKLTWTPAVASRGPNLLDVIVGGELDSAYWLLAWNGGGWLPWSSLGGQLSGGAAAIAGSIGTVDVFGQGLDQALWHCTRSYTPLPAIPWHPTGSGVFLGEPRIASWAPYRLDCFATYEGALIHSYSKDYGATFTTWENLGQPTASVSIIDYPAVVSRGPRLLDIVVNGSDNFLWQLSWDGINWSAWKPIGIRPVVGSPALASWAPTRLDIFVLDTNSDLSQIYSNDGGATWSDGTRLGRPPGTSLFSAPVAIAWAPNRLDVFVTGADHGLWQMWWG